MDYPAGLRCPSKPWWAAPGMAANGPSPTDVRDPGLSRRREHCWQPTSTLGMTSRMGGGVERDLGPFKQCHISIWVVSSFVEGAKYVR
jgi:hypothetical protein